MYIVDGPHTLNGGATRRSVSALQAVLPATAIVEIVNIVAPDTTTVRIGPHRLLVRWIGRGSVRTVLQALAGSPKPQVLAGSELSLAAREAASNAGVGWVDESGAAEIVTEAIVVSRTGRHRNESERPQGWTPTVLGVAEAILCGTPATASATAQATGHSLSTTAHALAVLTDLGLLQRSARRGRNSGRSLDDSDELLEQYADAARRLRRETQLRCGVLWQDPLTGIAQLGGRWTQAGVHWAATGALGAAVLAPLLTNIAGGEVYVEATGEPGLLNAAHAAGIEPIEGGRLVLRPFPTAAADRLATEAGGVRVAPWPRVYADVRGESVRGEEAAEHLRELIGG